MELLIVAFGVVVAAVAFALGLQAGARRQARIDEELVTRRRW